MNDKNFKNLDQFAYNSYIALREKESIYTADIVESTSGTTEALFSREGIRQTEKISYMKETLKWAKQLPRIAEPSKI